MDPSIDQIWPRAAIPGGEIAIDLVPSSGRYVSVVTIDGVRAHVVAASRRRLLAIVPDGLTAGEVSVEQEAKISQASKTAKLIVGTKIAGDLHPVANPAFDPSDGALYVTRSGARGEHVPVSLYRVTSTSEQVAEEFSGDITNPTAIAFSPRGQMFVTSRLDGTVYRVSPANDCSVF